MRQNSKVRGQSYRSGVCSLRVVLQDSGQAEVRHLTHQVAVDQDVACSQVPVDVAQVCQVGHASCNATQHAHQLDNGELAIVPLEERKRGTQRLHFSLILKLEIQIISRTAYPQERIQRSILHVLSDDHNWFTW